MTGICAGWTIEDETYSAGRTIIYFDWHPPWFGACCSPPCGGIAYDPPCDNGCEKYWGAGWE